jgi:hypothetical protein
MLAQLGVPWPSFGWVYDSGDTPASTYGVSVTLGLSSAEGSWTQVASSANCAYDVYGFLLWIGGTTTSAINHECTLDVGVDPAGGSSYTEVIPNLLCGKSTTLVTGNAFCRYFPLFIKAGSSIAVRGSTSYSGQPGGCRVRIMLFGKPSNPHQIRAGQYAEGIGTVTSNSGVSFTPVSGSEGSWASLGTTTRSLWWAVLTFSISNGTIAAQYTNIDLAVGDGSNYDIIIENLPCFCYGTAEIIAQPSDMGHIRGHWEIPAGATLYVRGRCSTTPATGYNARVIGIGG